MNSSSEEQKRYCIYQCVSKDFRWDWAQTKKNMGRLNVVNFTIDQWTHNCSIMKEMFSTHKEGKFDVTERFIGAFNNEIYKYMIWI